jgi:hypothetical protein
MLIGLTGRNAAGKGEVARYLQRKSFYYYSLSDAIREEIRSRGVRSKLRRPAVHSRNPDLGSNVDRDFGPFFLKFCSYFPYNGKLYLNVHEYAKRQLMRKKIA